MKSTILMILAAFSFVSGTPQVVRTLLRRGKRGRQEKRPRSRKARQAQVLRRPPRKTQPIKLGHKM